MDAAQLGLSGVRAAHFLACIALFGELLFARVVARGVVRTGAVAWTLVLAVASAVVWLALEAVVMSGDAPAAAWQAKVLAQVVVDTQFGRAWLLRLVAAAIVAVALYPALRGIAAVREGRATVALAAAGAMLAALAWMGHAGAGSGAQRYGELAADVAHLLAAGTWLGMLPALAARLHEETDAQARAAITLRFSRCATAAVVVILFTGIVNTRFRVGTLDALIDSDYGHVLLVKIALVASMLVLAGVNRWMLTPRLVAHGAPAARALRRNALAEIAAGIAVVALVGALGITPPPDTGMAGMTHSAPAHSPPASH